MKMYKTFQFGNNQDNNLIIRTGRFFMFQEMMEDEGRVQASWRNWRKTIFKIILAIFLWAITIIRIVVYGKGEGAQETLVKAFNQIALKEMKAEINAVGFYGDVYLSDATKETFVKEIGYQLGLNYCDLFSEREGNLATTGIRKDGKYADTEIKLITREEKVTDTVVESKQYISVNIDLGNNLDAAMQYQKTLKDIFADMKVEADINVNLTGYIEGHAELTMKNLIANQLIETMKGKIVAENRNEELFTIYAYTDKVEDYIEISGKKINLNISANYDEQLDRTYFYVATPMINGDY